MKSRFIRYMSELMGIAILSGFWGMGTRALPALIEHTGKKGYTGFESLTDQNNPVLSSAILSADGKIQLPSPWPRGVQQTQHWTIR